MSKVINFPIKLDTFQLDSFNWKCFMEMSKYERVGTSSSDSSRSGSSKRYNNVFRIKNYEK